MNRRLRHFMIDNGYKSLRQMAEPMGLHVNTLYAVDKGKASRMRIDTLRKVSGFIGCTIEELIKGT